MDFFMKFVKVRDDGNNLNYVSVSNRVLVVSRDCA